TAIQMGTINTARHYRLRNHGAIAPRYWADFIVLEDLEQVSIRRVYKKGRLVAENGTYRLPKQREVQQPRSTMNLSFNAKRDFTITASTDRNSAQIRVIEIVPNQIVTRSTIEKATIRDGKITAD